MYVHVYMPKMTKFRHETALSMETSKSITNTCFFFNTDLLTCSLLSGLHLMFSEPLLFL